MSIVDDGAILKLAELMNTSSDEVATLFAIRTIAQAGPAITDAGIDGGTRYMSGYLRGLAVAYGKILNVIYAYEQAHGKLA